MSFAMRSDHMRPYILSVALLCASASPAPAQINPSVARDLDNITQQQQQLQRSIALENQINAIDSRVQTEQRLRDFDASRVQPNPVVPSDPNARADTTTLGGFASIPDASLAASNARVRAVTQNRR